MADVKLYTLEDLKKMSATDRTKLMVESQIALAHTIQDIRTGKEKQTHKKGQWEAQISRIQTLNNQTVSNEN